MRDFLSISEATRDNFLFVSYSHDDTERVIEWVDFLLNSGVRAWCDKAFRGGDDWETIATALLNNENCCGILFFCSNSAIGSINVKKEWLAAASTKQNRDSFYSQIIMVDDSHTLNYKYLTNFVKTNVDMFSDDDFDDFRDLFGKKDHIFYSSDNESDKQELFRTIKEKTPEAVDEHAIITDKLANIANHEQDIIFRLGTNKSNKRPLLWRQLNSDSSATTLLCEDVLAEEFGGHMINEWLNKFFEDSFSKEEQRILKGKLRLLSADEAAAIPVNVTQTGKIWWLSDCSGNLQSVVREDGTIYHNGYNNRLYQKGIRPVIIPDSVLLCKLLEERNNI